MNPKDFTTEEKQAISNALHSYMSFRASQEGHPYSLSPAFFQFSLDKGFTTFFGVSFDRNGLVEDVQQPGLFGEWKSQCQRKRQQAN
jgi:hypothetical protein